MTIRRLLWDGRHGVARRGDVLVRLRRAPDLPEIGDYSALRFDWPSAASVVQDGFLRRLTLIEARAVLRMLERLAAEVDDVLDGRCTLTVVFA